METLNKRDVSNWFERNREALDLSIGVEARMDEGFTHIGAQEIWRENNSLALSQTDRRQHVYMVGKTGTGKTTLLRNMIVQDIEAGRGVAVIDPHGELAEEILDHIPPRRTDDVVYFNPADMIRLSKHFGSENSSHGMTGF